MRNNPKQFSIFGVMLLVGVSLVAGAQSLPDSSLPPFYSAMRFVRQSRQLDTSGSWMRESAIAVKCFVSEDGVHKITHNWLQNAGISPFGINPLKIRLVRNGIGIPVYLKGLDDGRFDQQDAIYFIGKRNYDNPDYYRQVALDDPHPQYLNKYSDSSAYWLFFDDQPSPVMNARALPAGNADTVNSHTRLSHYEPELSLQYMGTSVDRINFAEWTREDTWIMQFIEPGQTKTLPFEMENYISDRNPLVRVSVAGYQGPSGASLNHKLVLRLKGGGLIDSASFGTTDQLLLAGEIQSNLASDGNQLLEIESEEIQTLFTRAVIDNYEIEYHQRLVASGKRLNFGPLSESGELKYVKISGITDTNCIVLCDGKYSSYAVHPKYVSDGGAWSAVFADTLYPESRYGLTSSTMALIPTSPAKLDQTNLRKKLPSTGWLAITAREFEIASLQYAEFISQTYGVSTTVVTVEDIYDSYSFGVFNPEAIKLFLYDFLKKRHSSETLPYIAILGDANYNFKDKSPKYGENFVPGYGFPVSDMLYVAFDSLGAVQHANIGRIPVRTSADLQVYLERHRNYLDGGYAEWNKSFLLVSGGDAGENDAQLAFYRNINEEIASNNVVPAPFGGKTTHIYKTASPPSQFGPYSEEQARKILNNGGIAISYVGHSATTMWDNGIDDPDFLANKESGRPPLVTDFGCSSGKFAEPNAISFSEMYVSAPDAPGLCYIGNASFGYRSTAQSFPVEFYKILFRQGVTTIGDAHLLAKKAMVERFGPTISIRNAVQMSTLVGDPILRLAIPQKPDAAVSPSDIAGLPSLFTDGLDSLRFNITVHNYGLVPAGDLTVQTTFGFAGQQIAEKTLKIPFPLLSETISVAFPSPGTTGDGSLRVTLDLSNKVAEINETNNQAEYTYSILNSGVKIINRMPSSSGKDTITILNPYLNPGEVTGVILESDISPAFTNPQITRYNYGAVASFLTPLPTIPVGKKRYIRLKLDGITSSYSDTYSIWGGQALAFFQKDSVDWSLGAISNLALTNKGITTLPAIRELRVVSAGPFEGSLGDVLMNGASVFPPLAVKGYYIAVFNGDSMTIKVARAFATAVSASEADSLAAFLNARTGNELIAIAASADPVINRGRYSSAFRAIGAKFIDSVQNQGSYALIGRPGAAPGSAKERLTAPMDGPAIMDTTLSALGIAGVARSYRIGPAGRWKAVQTSAEGDLNASTIRIIGLKRDGSEQQLLETLLGGSIDISHLDSETYPWLYLEAWLKNGNYGAPKVNSWGVDFLSAPELAMNYQSVYLERDSMYAGVKAILHHGILNAGETEAKTTDMNIEQTYSGAGGGVDTTLLPDPPLPGEYAAFLYSAPAILQAGEVRLSIDFDTNGQLQDQIAANNRFSVDYIVLADSTPPDLRYAFDGVIPLEGDYISANPLIRLELSAEFSPVTSPDAFKLMIDGQQILPSDPAIHFIPSSRMQSATFEYRPVLVEGTHEFRINAVSPSGISAYEGDAVINLTVSKTMRIKDMYPVPNPFSESTAFSFMLGGSVHPERAEIKVYTVAGRLVRTLEIPMVQLRVGINIVPWDGRDGDGDLLANGAYFYRLTVFSISGNASSLGKLSVLR